MSSDASTSFPLSSAPSPPLSSSSYGSLPLHLQPSLPTFGPSDPGYYASTASAPYSPPHVHSQQPLHNFFAPHPPSASFPGYQPPPSFSSHSTSYPSHPPTDAFSTHPSTPSVDAPPSDRSASTKPPVGSIRCYWVILSARLDFVFLDPILEHHMGDYAIKLVGTNLLDWVHPDEKDSLRDDLMPKEDEVAGIEGVGVFGSMTRCRYSRVVRIMRDLGCERPPQPEDAKIYAIDDEYLNLDVTTSWIAGDRKGKGKLNGAVLAFFHATTDKDAQHDNDLRNRSDWTNWCGPNDPDYFTPTNCAELLSALSRCATVPSPSSSTFLDDEDAGPPAHVFQILDRAGRAIATFPKSADHSRGEKGKSYDVEEFAALAREVLQRPREAVASKTSCTRRYRSKHPVMKDGTLTTVESVVIMYGAITFACFQTGGVYMSSARKAGLSLSTDFSGPAGGDFNLEDVPPTTPTVSMGQNGHSNGIKRSPGVEDGRETSMSPPNKRFKTSTASEVPSIQATAPPNDSMDPPQPINGLSILTGGRMFRNTLDVESITAGGISPTVATASAILGSFSLHNQPPQFQQYPHYTPPLAAHSPSQPPPTSYNAFFASHGPPLGHTFAPFPAPSPQMSYPPPSSSSYSYATQPHPLSQSHSAYFPPAQQEPHEPASGGGAFPGPTSRPFQGFGNGGEEYGQQQQQQQQQQQHEQDQEHLQQQQQQQQEEQQETFQEPAPPPPPPQPTTTRTAVIMPDPALIPVPPPPPPGSQAGKKPPKQRPEGPVFKPNVKACESCGTVNSPEWRKGPTGAKSLCNACGLRYARSVSRAKKLAEAAANGTAPKKGGKKKAAAAAAAAAAAVAAAASANDSPKDSPGSSSQTSPLPPQHPPTIITNLPPGGAYDLSGYARASPKPYSPYFATAPPPAPGAYVPSPTGSQGPSFQHSPLSATSAPGGGGGGASQYFPSLGYSAAPPYSAPTMHSPLPPVPNPSPYSDYPRPSFSHSHSHSNSLSHSHSHSHPHSLSQSLPYSHSYSHASSPHLQQQQQQQQQQPQQQPQSLAMYPSHSDGSQSQHSSQQQQSPQVPQQGGAGSYAQQRFNGNGGWGGGQDEGGGTIGNRNGGGGGGAEGEEGG